MKAGLRRALRRSWWASELDLVVSAFSHAEVRSCRDDVSRSRRRERDLSGTDGLRHGKSAEQQVNLSGRPVGVRVLGNHEDPGMTHSGPVQAHKVPPVVREQDSPMGNRPSENVRIEFSACGGGILLMPLHVVPEPPKDYHNAQ